MYVYILVAFSKVRNINTYLPWDWLVATIVMGNWKAQLHLSNNVVIYTYDSVMILGSV